MFQCRSQLAVTLNYLFNNHETVHKVITVGNSGAAKFKFDYTRKFNSATKENHRQTMACWGLPTDHYIFACDEAKCDSDISPQGVSHHKVGLSNSLWTRGELEEHGSQITIKATVPVTFEWRYRRWCDGRKEQNPHCGLPCNLPSKWNGSTTSHHHHPPPKRMDRSYAKIYALSHCQQQSYQSDNGPNRNRSRDRDYTQTARRHTSVCISHRSLKKDRVVLETHSPL